MRPTPWFLARLYACAHPYHPGKYQATIDSCFGLVGPHQNDVADTYQGRLFQTSELKYFLSIFVSIPNEYFLVSCLLEDFKLKIDGGEFTDSEIIVMLGENGINEFNCFVFRGEGWVRKGTCIWELYPWFLYTVSAAIFCCCLFVCFVFDVCKTTTLCSED